MLDRSTSRFIDAEADTSAALAIAGQAGVPLDESDFQQHDWIPDSGWPITYEDLRPYYQKAQTLLELNDKDFMPKTWRRKDAPIWSLGKDFETRVYKFSPPTRFGKLYRDELRQSKNIKCLLNASVTRINLSTNGTRVDNLTVQHSLGKKTIRVTGKTVVLAAGGLENPRLLLNSTHHSPNGIANEYDVVGRYFMEHPHLHSEGRFYRTHGMPSIKLYTRHSYQDQIIKAYLRIPPKLRAERKLLNLSMCIEPVRRTTISKAHRSLMETTAETDGKRLKLNKKKQPMLLSCDLRSEQVPNRDSRISLSDERDALGLRRAQLDWRLSEIDKASMRATQLYFAKRLMSQRWSRFLLRLDETPTFSKRLKGGCHHMGTTRISDSPRTGVVDQHLKVHGIDNFYIAGSSTFPTGGAANPTLTIVALSLRLAQQLKG